MKKSYSKQCIILIKKVDFPIFPPCRNLSEETKELFIDNVPRDSPSDKISGLIDATNLIFNEMDHISYLKKLIIRFTPDRMDKLKNFSLMLAYTINILMIIAYDIQVKNLLTDVTNYAYNYNYTLDN